MKSKHAIRLLLATALALPLAASANPREWAAMKQRCIDSGGRPASQYYNDWVRLGGCLCPPDWQARRMAVCPARPQISPQELERQQDLHRQPFELQTERDWNAEEARRRAREQAEFNRRQAEAVAALSSGGGRAAGGEAGPKQAAWRQLHCAASILKPAIEALGIDGARTPDYREFRFLSAEAGNAMNGGRVSVACDSAPPFPQLSASLPEPSMDRVVAAQGRMVARVALLGDKLEQARDRQREGAPPREVTAARKTEEETRRELKKIKTAQEKVEAGEPDALSSVVGWDEAPAQRPRQAKK